MKSLYHYDIMIIVTDKDKSLKPDRRQAMVRSDYRMGYQDRMNHIYDKWYRYNRADDGAEYDRGVALFLNQPHSDKWYEEDEELFRIIQHCE